VLVPPSERRLFFQGGHVRALVPVGLAALLAAPVAASAQTFYGIAGGLNLATPVHKYESSAVPLVDKYGHGIIPPQRWSAEQVALATTATTFILLDWITTADAIRRCQADGTVCSPAVEQNPLLGRSPSLTTLRMWSLVGISGSLVGGLFLHRRWMRTAWFATITAAEFMMVQHNVRAGLHLTLHF
jgi:hypothetical protein